MRRLALLVAITAVFAVLYWLRQGPAASRREPSGQTDRRDVPAQPSAPAPQPPEGERPGNSPGPASRPAAAPAPPTAEDTMILRLRGPSGEAVDDARIAVRLRLFAGLWTAGGTARKRADGAWTVIRHAQPGLDEIAVDEPGRRWVRIESGRYGRLEVPFAAGPQDVRYEEPSQAVFIVSGGPRSGVHLALLPPRERVNEQQIAGHPVSPSGRVVITAQPGAYNVLVFLRTAAGDPVHTRLWPLARTPMRLVVGSAEHSIALALHTVRVRTEPAAAGAVFMLEPAARRVDTHSLRARADREGMVSFPFVLPGRYRLRDAMGRLMFLDVPGKGTPTFQPASFDALRVVLDSERKGGYWVESGVRDRELIVAINGKRFQPTHLPGELVPRRRTSIDQKARLTVRSDSGAEREVEVLYWRFFGEKGAVGWLEPVPVGTW